MTAKDSKSSRETPSALTESEKELGARGDLQMSPELMRDLARKAAEILVERNERLPGEDAWEGDFRQGLEEELLKDPPEDGRPMAVWVLERFTPGRPARDRRTNGIHRPHER